MRHYNIQVNGTSHSLDVEQTGPDTYQVALSDDLVVDVVVESSQEAAPADGTTPAAPVRPAAPAPARPASAPRAAAGPTGKAFTAPMPGTVLSVAVGVGDSVRRGQTLMVLEAMKMKNELKAPADGTVAAVHIHPGDQVKTGDPLFDF
ncbi:MAG: acetyl-CoA carboxylase biotin carboxyl carrier protein subunit [Propionibacteriaceae bacterium]|nr:acetyl-CoA carboxylase biotin carboxyl carrier protein subunit [Propionibacteriaceae bacterium]